MSLWASIAAIALYLGIVGLVMLLDWWEEKKDETKH